MSYEVLARRWRPKTFDEVAGQNHVTTTLCNAIRSDRVPHALLLCGPRGVGKTTIARILARALNCDEGPTEKPCGVCEACKGILNATSMDVQEIDAASYTGVDHIREIRDSIRYSAAPGKYRIFIIDEVHMLSQAAFNALLKTLEEPPPHSLFVFATTNPQKIPITVLSRVQRFDLKRLGTTMVLERLREIAAAESLDVPESILRGVARLADGSVRDSLTLLDRLVSGLGSSISEEDARQVLDLVDRNLLRQIIDPILAHDASAAMLAVRGALETGLDPARVTAELLEELRNLVVARVVKDADSIIEAGAEEVAELQQRVKAHDPETLQNLFRVMLMRSQEINRAAQPAHVLEMAVVRLATLPDVESVGAILARLNAGSPAPSPDDGGPRASRSTPPGSSVKAKGASARRPTRPAGPPSARRDRPRDPERDAQVRNAAKVNPVVKQAIEVLDAELREIRLDRVVDEPESP